LHSGDLTAPFPEEYNRRATGLLASHHFAPTEAARMNLLREGIEPGRIIVTGNTVVDAAQMVLGHLDALPLRLAGVYGCLDAILPFAWRDGGFVLLTFHRREMATDRIAEILNAFARLAEMHPAVNFVWPVHPNPLVRGPAQAQLSALPNLHLVEPLPYDAFLVALRHCRFVLTDSGGLQEEGPALGKPVLVMRELTERPEAVEAGGVRIVGTQSASIVASTSELLTDVTLYDEMARAPNPYGDGKAAQRIAAVLKALT